MLPKGTKRIRVGNKLLAALPVSEYKQLAPSLESAPLRHGDVLHDNGETIRYVYFPLSGIVSLMSAGADGSTIEVGMVGNEGMTGLPVVLGVGRATERAMVRSAGDSVRIEAGTFGRLWGADSALGKMVLRFVHALMIQISQTSVCNRFHGAEARLARSLLMTCDRTGSNELHLTQEFLARVLGVRREGVTVAAGALQLRGSISYRRGKITIVDRTALESASCGCYKRIKTEYDRVLTA